MNPLWAYFWPVLTIGLLFGGVPGIIWLRRKRRILPLVIAAALALAFAALWHGPLGAADRFTASVERTSRTALVEWEMAGVQARLHRLPLSRRLLLSGTADDFQRQRLVEIMSEIPGVATATWQRSGGIPLVLEAAAVAMLGFLVGLLIAYLVELRRRYNAQWKW